MSRAVHSGMPLLLLIDADAQHASRMKAGNGAIRLVRSACTDGGGGSCSGCGSSSSSSSDSAAIELTEERSRSSEMATTTRV